MTTEQKFKVPFIEGTQAIKEVLEACEELGLMWFDCSVPPEQIHTLFKQQSEFAYGVLTTSDADTKESKSMVFWDFWLDLEIYSNYKGRKVVAQKIEALINYLSDSEDGGGFTLLCEKLSAGSYNLLSISTGKLHIGLPERGEIGVWQYGSIPLVLHLEQKKEEVNN